MLVEVAEKAEETHARRLYATSAHMHLRLAHATNRGLISMS